MEKVHAHPHHEEVLKRLKRAAGHLQAVLGMIEEGRPCLGIAQQLHAVEAAITNAKRMLIHDHLDHCLDHALSALPRDERRIADDFKAIAKFL